MINSHAQKLTMSNSSQSVIFSNFGKDDVDQAVAVHQACGPHPWTPSHFETSLAAGHFCLAAKLNGNLIGFIVVQDKTYDAEIFLVAVHPDAQRNGIGRSLILRAIKHCQEKAERIFLEVRESNNPAIELYESLMFNQVGVREGYYPPIRRDAKQADDNIYSDRRHNEDAYIYALEFIS